jgi:hypothetical protein
VVTFHLELQQAHEFSGSWPEFAAAEAQILALLKAAWDAAINDSPSVVRTAFWRGAAPDSAWLALHAAEEALLPLQSDDVVRAKAKTIVAWARETLGAADPRVAAVLDGLHRLPDKTVVPGQLRQLLKALLRSANDASDTSYVSTRSFRNLVAIATLLSALFAILIGVLAAVWPSATGLCNGSICPAGQGGPAWSDGFDVELCGILGAVLAAAYTLRRASGTRNPYGIGFAQGLLKISLGALTALGGVALVQSGLISCIVKPTSSGQILAFAIVFGYSQQLITHLVDTQALAVVHTEAKEGS